MAAWAKEHSLYRPRPRTTKIVASHHREIHMHAYTSRRPAPSRRPGQGVWATLLSLVIGVTLIAAVLLGWGLLHEFWLFVIYWLQP